MTLAQVFTASGSASFQLDKGATLRGVQTLAASSFNVILTTNPSHLLADLTAAGATAVLYDVIAVAASTAQIPSQFVGGLSEKLKANTTYFLIADAPGSCLLVFS